MKTDIKLAGVGGQGILSIATVLGEAAAEAGLQLKQAEVHGMSQRGGDVQSDLRLSTDRFDLGIMRPGETKERSVVALHRDENDRTETLAITFTPDDKTPKGLQHIPYTVVTTEQGKQRQLVITLDVMIK